MVLGILHFDTPSKYFPLLVHTGRFFFHPLIASAVRQTQQLITVDNQRFINFSPKLIPFYGQCSGACSESTKRHESGEGVKNVVREPRHGIFWPTRPDPVGAPNFHVKTCAFYRKKQQHKANKGMSRLAHITCFVERKQRVIRNVLISNYAFKQAKKQESKKLWFTNCIICCLLSSFTYYRLWTGKRASNLSITTKRA